MTTPEKSSFQRAVERGRMREARRLGSGPNGRKYLRGGAGPLNTPRVDTRPRATPITPSWLCDCGRYNAPQRDACTECQSDKPTDAA